MSYGITILNNTKPVNHQKNKPLILRLFFTSSLLSMLQSVQGSPAPTNLLATRVGPCKNVKNLVISVSEMAIYSKIYDSTITGRFNISKNITNGWNIRGTMQKCQDIRNLQTCDHFKSFEVVKSGCGGDSDPDEQDTYNMFFHHTTPRLSCPVAAGQYHVQGYPFYSEDNYLSVSEAKISTSLFGYTYRLDGYLNSSKLHLFCVEARLQLLYVREHRWGQDAPAHTPAPSNAEDDTADDDQD